MYNPLQVGLALLPFLFLAILLALLIAMLIPVVWMYHVASRNDDPRAIIWTLAVLVVGIITVFGGYVVVPYYKYAYGGDQETSGTESKEDRRDWSSLLIGAFLALVSMYGCVIIVQSLGVTLPSNLGQIASRPVEWYILAIALLLFTLPGAIVAGYLHSTDLRAGASYGVAAIGLGLGFPFLLFLPLIGFLFLVGGIGGLASLAFPYYPLIPVIMIAAFIVGVGGGTLGSLLKRNRVETQVSSP